VFVCVCVSSAMMPDIAVPTFPAIPKDAAKDFQGRVAIIGAGVSGLFAANTLKFLGVTDYVVLEASGTFGGRLKSKPGFHDEVHLELGAEWIHSHKGDVVKDMLVFPAEEGLEESEFIKYQPQWFFGGSRSRFLEWIYQETKWKRLSYGEWLEKYVYRHVQDKVQFNAVVKEVAYGEGLGGQVRLRMADGAEILADKVICTIPLPVMKIEGRVNFDPPLPQAMRNAINKVDSLPGFRVIFEMKEKFYPDLTGESLWQLAKDHDQVCFAYDALYGKELSNNQNVLCFVAIGEKCCKDMDNLDDEDLAKACLAKIDQLFDGQGTKNYIKHAVQNWSREPHILGAYSVGGKDSDREELRRTVNGKVLFAGEHTCVSYYSLVPGAALEGRRAAVEAVSSRVLADSKEPFLTYVMPISQAGCWAGLALSLRSSNSIAKLRHDWVLAACGFYWSWAIKNRIAGPLWTDMAVFSMFPGLAAAAMEKARGGRPTRSTTIGCAFGCLLVLLNYLKAISLFKGQDPAAIAARLKKSTFWAKTFISYCHSNVGFWGASAAILSVQSIKM